MMDKRPKLKDKVYGEMVWSEYEDEGCWYARMTTETGDEFDLSILAETQADFLAVRGTHATYREIIDKTSWVIETMIADLLEHFPRSSKMKQQRKALEKTLGKSLRLYSIAIYYDFSSTVSFVEKVAENQYPDDVFYALLDNNGEFLEAGIEDL